MDDLIIKGIAKTSLIDYPGKICSVVFLTRCNFRCSFCYNPELVFDTSEKTEIAQEEFFEFLDKKKKWLDGVCITGGEPTLHKGLIDFITKIKNKGFLVKLDTNGTNPDVIEHLINNDLVDYISMDIKGDEENYEKVTNCKVDISKIKKTIEILKNSKNLKTNSNFDYEFRTTVHPDFFNEEILKRIIKMISGAKRYALQQIKSDFKTIDNLPKKEYNKELLEKFVEIAKPYFENCELRNE